MNEQITQIIARHLNADTYAWLQQAVDQLTNASALHRTFGQITRKTGKIPVALTEEERVDTATAHVEGWTIDRLCRVHLLSRYNDMDAKAYHQAIEKLFLAADLNELVALYSALPFLSYPEGWTARCAEGIRSNVGNVLEAIMHYNPYPARHLGEAAWNQMVLKAFFTDKNPDLISGLKERNNQTLALTLLDYVHERRAAGRTVNPVIWRLIGAFAVEAFMQDFDFVMEGNDEEAKEQLKAGIVTSDYEPAKQFIQQSF